MDYNLNLICENKKLCIFDPITRLMMYRRIPSKQMIDRDRCEAAYYVYDRFDWNLKSLEPDTFLGSPYNYLTNFCRKYDKKYYVEDYKDFVIRKNEDYAFLTKSRAQDLRYEWFSLKSTIVHYRYILSNLIPYVDAGHKIGSFHMVPKGFGQIKCCKFKEDGIRVLDFFEHNWNDIKHSYNNVSFSEYKEIYFLEEACSRKDLMIDFKDDLDLNLKKINELSQIIENRNQRIINRLEGNEYYDLCHE